MTVFENDIKKGNKGESIFYNYIITKSDNVIDVSKNSTYQALDVDYLVDGIKYEVKSNYRDNNCLIIEEYTNCNSTLGNISYGWAKKTQADKIVFVSNNTMIILNWNDDFKRIYNEQRKLYDLQKNQITYYGNSGKKRQGAYRIIPLEPFKGLYITIKKNN